MTRPAQYSRRASRVANHFGIRLTRSSTGQLASFMFKCFLPVVAALGLAACGSSQVTTVTQTTQHTATAHGMSRAQAGRIYESDVAPAEAALTTFSTKASAWTDSTTGDQADADSQPVVAALDRLSGQLLSLAQQYPPAASDIKSQVKAYTPVEGDLATISSQSIFSAASWVQQFMTDVSNTKAASAIVLSDLGLPPASTSDTSDTSSDDTTQPAPDSAPKDLNQGQALSGAASTLRTHLADLGSGHYQAAFGLMSPSYQSQNPSWAQDRSTADPGINVISVGQPQSVSGGARVPVDFYAQDRAPSPGSDTKCREFQGTASMIEQAGSWYYNPGANSLTTTVVPSSNPNCPTQIQAETDGQTTTADPGTTGDPGSSSCSPMSDSGTCYEPGEYCRAADHGLSGTDGNGDPITCADNNGWRWEPGS